MFYKMIENQCSKWYLSDDCTVKNIIEYIEKTGQMRDAQIEAIKIYLFLKIKCECKPLATLFERGVFNSVNLDEIDLATSTRKYLQEHPAAAALFEYSRLQNEKGEQVSEKLEKQIKKNPSGLDYGSFFRDAFYGVSYTDYLFSLPMGAGKTYLMAAFIYLDLYFALNEPSNPAFAHNFMVFAPSGLKSSVVPSLKTIQRFDPSWIIPEPAAGRIKRMISFEVLEENKTSRKSNKTRDPNVQKIATHQPFSKLFGLVAVTNAEKVILNRIQEKNGQIEMYEDSDDEKNRQANELRNLIGKLPFLSIFIDEVHHAVSDEKKLRAVVTKWAKNRTVNSVIGFSGTPYLEKTKKFKINDLLSVGTAEITNVVYYYPLIDGIGNFLKRPVVKIAEIADSALIIEKGVRDFLDTYKDTVYANGTVAKLGIYCGGAIEKLEETVYPLVVGIAAEYGLPPEAILKFHRGNERYRQPVDSQMQFDILDSPISNTRIVLLVQIGKEGWNCRSLTGIILSQEGDCPTNMVLQTSCRCLRQVVRGQPETALIYLNKSNAEKLNLQLEQQCHITLKEFSSSVNEKAPLKRYDRTARLKLPQLGFYQLKINYGTVIVEKADPAADIAASADSVCIADGVIKTTDFSMDKSKMSIQVDNAEYGIEPATFNSWLYGIAKGGFGFPSMEEMAPFQEQLRGIFEKLTYEKDGCRYYSSKFDRKRSEANIRKAFHDKRDYTIAEEWIPETASLLNANFTTEIYTDKPEEYYPDSEAVEIIIFDDEGKSKPDGKMADTIRYLEESGQSEIAAAPRKKTTPHKNKDRSFHYLPYHTDSCFEQTFLRTVLSLDVIEKLNLEVYYNGDRTLTEFKIKCYRKRGEKWNYIGVYTPDFLVIKRKDGKIYKAMIAETKGKIYANDPIFEDKRKFMSEFLKQNKNKCNYERFGYLYLEDTLTENELITRTKENICKFFNEEVR